MGSEFTEVAPTDKLPNFPCSRTNEQISMMWIRLHTNDDTNYPKDGSSCNLVNDRLVFMAGGCWGLGVGNCANYGWDPLVYDIAAADWSWSYHNAEEGYFVPKQIYHIIGGK